MICRLFLLTRIIYMQEFAGALAVLVGIYIHTCGTQLAKCQAGWVLFASAGKFLHVYDSQSIKKVFKSCKCAVKPCVVFQ